MLVSNSGMRSTRRSHRARIDGGDRDPRILDSPWNRFGRSAAALRFTALQLRCQQSETLEAFHWWRIFFGFPGALAGFWRPRGPVPARKAEPLQFSVHVYTPGAAAEKIKGNGDATMDLEISKNTAKS